MRAQKSEGSAKDDNNERLTVTFEETKGQLLSNRIPTFTWPISKQSEDGKSGEEQPLFEQPVQEF